MLGKEGRENVVDMNECVNVVVGNAIEREVGPCAGVANIIDQNGYVELLERGEECVPVFDALAGIRTDDDYVHPSMCSLEVRLDFGEFLSVAAVYY
jgi:hypothetical protein